MIDIVYMAFYITFQGVLLHCLALLRFPFYKGKDHLEMLNNIFEHEDLPNDNNLEESIQNLITCLLVIDDVSELFLSIQMY